MAAGFDLLMDEYGEMSFDTYPNDPRLNCDKGK